MSTTEVPESYPTYSMVGDRYTLLLTGEQTAGAYAVVEAFVPPGGGPPAHVHSREDEAFMVVEGEFEFSLGGERVRLTAGGFVFGPRGVPHAFKSVGPTNGSMHKGDALRQLRDDFPRLTVEWLPPYAPELNPVEHLWSHLKFGHCANLIPDNLQHLDDEVTDFLVETQFLPQRLQSYWTSTPLTDAVAKRAA